MKPPASHRVRRLAELRVVASPQRQEILVALQALQPCSVREIGRYLGRLPVSLYYHLKKLEQVGLVMREEGESSETIYSLPALELRIAPDKRGKREVEALRKIGAGMFRRAQRLYDLAVAEETQAGHLMGQRTVGLSRRGAKRVRRKLLEVLEAIDEERTTKSSAFYTLTLHLAPNPAHSDLE